MQRRVFLMAGAAALNSHASTAALEIRIGARAATSLYYGEEWDKPFLWPIRTPSGRVISRGFPIEKRAGETNDHAWHRGLWFGHGLVNGEDFWRERGRDKTSRLIAVAPPKLTTTRAGTDVVLDVSMVTPKQQKLGSIRQQFLLRDAGLRRWIDVRLTVRADGGVALVFGDTDDGGFAFRLSDAFREDRGARLRNSEGLMGTEKIWGKPARWVHYAATLDGTEVGVAVFDHPANLRHPTTWHARGYSLCAANPFGLRSFTRDPTRDGSYTVPAGSTLALRYGVLIHEGPVEVEPLYREYAR